MNKILSRIATACVGLAMAVGVGVAVGSSDRALKAEAGTSTLSFTDIGTTGKTGSEHDQPISTTEYTSLAEFYYGDYTFKIKNAKKRNDTTAPEAIILTKKTGQFFNVTPMPGNITNVNIVVPTGASGSAKYGVAFSSTAYSTFTNNDTGTKNIAANSNDDFAPSISNARYFCVYADSKQNNNGQVADVIVTYESGPTKLSAPTGIAYNNNLQRVTWNSVANATGYYFSSDNGSTWSDKTTNTYYSVANLANGNYSVKVKAAGDGGTNYNDSDPADFALTKVSTPTYTAVIVTSGSLTGSYKGSAYIQCSAEVQGEDDPSTDVTWSITSSNTFGTGTEIENIATIDQTGKVVFLDNTNSPLYVWALAADEETKGFTTVSASGLTYEKGSQYNPYTVSEASDIIDGLGGTGSNIVNNEKVVFVTGVVSGSAESALSGAAATFNITDGAKTIKAYSISGASATDTSSDYYVNNGYTVLISGALIDYRGTYEVGFASGYNSSIVSSSRVVKSFNIVPLTGATTRFLKYSTFNATNDKYSAILTYGINTTVNLTNDTNTTWTLNTNNVGANIPLNVTTTFDDVEYFDSVNVEVYTVEIDKLSVDASSAKTEYVVGDSLVTTGLLIKGLDVNDNVTADSISISDCTFSPTTLNSVGENIEITVSYTNIEHVVVYGTFTVSVAPVAVTSVTFDATAYDVYENEYLTTDDVDAWTVHATWNNDETGRDLESSEFTVEIGGAQVSIPHKWSLSDSGKKLTVKFGGVSSTGVDVTVTESLDEIEMPVDDYSSFEPVKSIKVGDVVYLATRQSKNQLSGISTTSTKYGTYTSYQSAPSKSLYALTVVQGKTEGTFAFQHGSNYLNWSSGNSLSVSTTLSNNTSWTVSFDGSGNATILNAADSSRRLLWNARSGQNRFACYASTTPDDSGSENHNVQLFGDVFIPAHMENIANTSLPAQKVVLEFANYFLEQLDDVCVSANYTSEAFATQWGLVSAKYENLITNNSKSLSEDDLALAKQMIANASEKWDGGDTLQRALARYKTIVTHSELAKFMESDRPVSQLGFGFNTGFGSSESSTPMIIALISIASVTAIGGFFFLKKRKEK